MTGPRKRGTHEAQMIFQANRLLAELEKISLDPRRILEAWMEDAEAIDAAAERQEKAKAVLNRFFLANQIRLFGQRLEAALENLPEASREDREVALGILRGFVPHFIPVTAAIPFASEPKIRVTFEGESNGCSEE